MTNLATALALFAALAGAEEVVVDHRAEATETQVPPIYRLEPCRFVSEVEPLGDVDAYEVSAVRFPSPVVTAEPANNTVHAEYFRPKVEGKRPGVVVLHILGGDFALSRYLAARLASRGVAALFLKLPYYGERKGNSSDRLLSPDLEKTQAAMRQAILDVRRGADWLAARDEVDPSRLGVTGISLGGIVSSVAAGVDPQIGRVAILLAGGGLADILWDNPEPDAARYREAWIKAGKTKAELEEMTRPFDPLTYAANLRGKKVLMMAGRVDEVIPPSATEKLWEKAGRPPLVWYDCGHYSSVGFLLPAIRATADFFADDRLPNGIEPVATIKAATR